MNSLSEKKLPRLFGWVSGILLLAPGYGCIRFDVSGIPSECAAYEYRGVIYTPPGIGDRVRQQNDPYAFFNRTTLASSDYASPYTGSQGIQNGALYPGLAGPLGSTLVQKLADPNVGLILDSWIDANGAAQGYAGNFVQ